MEPLTKQDVELIVKDAIAQHELRFSIFGVVTAVIAALVGFVVANAPFN